jgi:hypothetical protein
MDICFVGLESMPLGSFRRRRSKIMNQSAAAAGITAIRFATRLYEPFFSPFIFSLSIDILYFARDHHDISNGL